MHNWPLIDGERVVPFTSLRQWQLVSSTETEVLSSFAVDRETPDDFKEMSYKAYLMCFGSSGMFEQDDIEHWVSITTMSKRSMAQELRTHVSSAVGDLSVGSSLLLFRSRGDDRPAEFLCAERSDTLVETEDGLWLACRVISIEESVLRTQNLAVFL